MGLYPKNFENDFIIMMRNEKHDLIQTNSTLITNMIFFVSRIEFINEHTMNYRIGLNQFI